MTKDRIVELVDLINKKTFTTQDIYNIIELLSIINTEKEDYKRIAGINYLKEVFEVIPNLEGGSKWKVMEVLSQL